MAACKSSGLAQVSCHTPLRVSPCACSWLFNYQLHIGAQSGNGCKEPKHRWRISQHSNYGRNDTTITLGPEDFSGTKKAKEPKPIEALNGIIN